MLKDQSIQDYHTSAMYRFWPKVKKCNHENGCIYCCWPWLAGIFKTGYGQFYYGNIDHPSHRMAWEFWNNRKIPNGLYIAHYCHNRLCCNPLHLHPATQKENMADSVRDHRVHPGTQHSSSKLKEEDIPYIFQLSANGYSSQEIANIMSVSRRLISAILQRKRWKHITLYL